MTVAARAIYYFEKSSRGSLRVLLQNNSYILIQSI